MQPTFTLDNNTDITINNCGPLSDVRFNPNKSGITITQIDPQIEKIVNEVCNIISSVREQKPINYARVNESIAELCGNDRDLIKSVFSSKKVLELLRDAFINFYHEETANYYSDSSIVRFINSNLDEEQKVELYSSPEAAEAIKIFVKWDTAAFSYFVKYRPDAAAIGMIKDIDKYMAYLSERIMHKTLSDEILTDPVLNGLAEHETSRKIMRAFLYSDTMRDALRKQMNYWRIPKERISFADLRKKETLQLGMLRSYFECFLGAEDANELVEFSRL